MLYKKLIFGDDGATLTEWAEEIIISCHREEILLLLLEGRNVKLSVSLLKSMGPFIIKQLHRQRIQFLSSHFCFHDHVSQKGQKHNYRMQQHTNKEILTVSALQKTFSVNCGGGFVAVMLSLPLSWRHFFGFFAVLERFILKKKRISLFQSHKSTFVLWAKTKKTCLNLRINYNVMCRRQYAKEWNHCVVFRFHMHFISC